MGTDLAGKVVAITGASSGIGEATALACAQAGAAVALAARRGDRIDRLAAQIAGDGGRALAVEADVSDNRGKLVARVNQTQLVLSQRGG